MSDSKQIKFDDCEALPQVAMPFMNTVHCEELTLVAKLLAKLQARAAVEDIDALVGQWLSHTEEHFAREERLMEEYRFPPYPVHKMEHTKALENLNTRIQQWSASHDYDALERYIQEDWRAWLQHHISTMDRVTANFFSQFDIEVEL